MKLHQLPKTTTSKKKRLGRGYGSGKGGHTATRGQKGQKSRSKVAQWFEGGQLPLTRKLPFLRGKDRFKSQNKPFLAINLSQLSQQKLPSTITPQVLVQSNIITAKEATQNRIKILGSGNLDTSHTFKDLYVSKSATAKINQAGGKVEPVLPNQQS